MSINNHSCFTFISFRVDSGSRSGDVTPGGSSRPGSALSTATTPSSGVIYRRPASARKPRPASIAGTGMTQESE